MAAAWSWRCKRVALVSGMDMCSNRDEPTTDQLSFKVLHGNGAFGFGNALQNGKGLFIFLESIERVSLMEQERASWQGLDNG